MDEKIFNRVEKKYIITKTDFKALHKIIAKKLKKDSYYKSEVYNIYFDTDNYDLIIQSIEQPVFKEKLRARSYKGYDKVFFEIKTKLHRGALKDEDIDESNNIGYKRRVLITRKDYQDFVTENIPFEKIASRRIEEKTDIQIAKEIDYFIKYMDLKPKILLYYNRESFVGEDGLRITFDTNLKYRDKNLKFSKNSHDKAYFKTEKCIIMEIKTNGHMPLWLSKTLSKMHIYPQRFSKIGNVYKSIRKEQNV